MKSSLSKLRRIALHKSAEKEKSDFHPLVKFDELVQVAKDMQEMRNCYDSLLSAAAATANSAYEFSESLREMGTCLLEKTASNDDEQSGKILGMLGRGQLELQKLVDSYRSHIFLTITNPSETLLNELRTVEDMKRQCNEKRDVYEYMIAQQKEKGRSKSGKSESITSQQLQAVQHEYEEEATLCAFRLKSLKQGQSRSLLTQAVRHHAAQLNFFRKGLQSLEAVEPHVRMVTEQQHIDYQFSGLEDDAENDYDGNDGGELSFESFDYTSNKQGPDVVSTSQNSIEVEESGPSYVQASMTETAEANIDKNQDLKVSSREPRVSSYSAPIYAEKKFDPPEKVRQQLAPSAVKSNAYVLPTPVDIKEANITKTSCSAPRNSDTTSTQLPLPLAEGLSLPQVDVFNAFDTKKVKRQAFSGPLTSKPLSVKPVLSGSSIGLTELPPLGSGVLSRFPMPQPLSPKASPSASPPLVSSPRISELHELPRPPGNQSIKPVKSSQIAHSAPLVFRNQEGSATNKFPSVASSAPSPLPTPPLIVSRSFSIPTSGQRGMALHIAKFLDTPQVPERAEEVESPPLTPISPSGIKSVSSISDLASHSNEIQVDAGGS